MSKHPTSVQIDPLSLARPVANLRYDKLYTLIYLLERELFEDAARDEARGRPKLALQLRDACTHLRGAAGALEKAWKICQPYEGLPGE